MSPHSLLAVRWLIELGVLAGVLYLLCRKAAADRVVGLLTGLSFAGRILVGEGLYFVSALHLPVLESEQVPGGFWTFALDADGYHAQGQIVLAALSGQPQGTQFADQPFAWLLGVLYFIFGDNPSQGLLLNAGLAAGCVPLAFTLARTLALGRAARGAGCALVAFWPSSFAWSGQPMRDPLVWCSEFLVLVGAAKLLEEPQAIRGRKLGSLAQVFAGGVFLVGLRGYSMLFLDAAIMAGIAVSLLRAVRPRLLRQALASSGMLCTTLLAATAASELASSAIASVVAGNAPVSTLRLPRPKPSEDEIAAYARAHNVSVESVQIFVASNGQLPRNAAQQFGPGVEYPAEPGGAVRYPEEVKAFAVEHNISEFYVEAFAAAQHRLPLDAEEQFGPGAEYPTEPGRPVRYRSEPTPQQLDGYIRQHGLPPDGVQGFVTFYHRLPESVLDEEEARYVSEHNLGFDPILTRFLAERHRVPRSAAELYGPGIEYPLTPHGPLRDNCPTSLLKTRRGFVTSGGASLVEEPISVKSCADLLKFIPRAVEQTFLAPLPQNWLRPGNTTGAFRYLAGMDSLILWLMLPGLVSGWWLSIAHPRPGLVMLLVYTTGLGVALGFVVTNFGILFRLRLEPLLPATIVAGFGWSVLLQRAAELPALKPLDQLIQAQWGSSRFRA